jgi:thiol:disulfide interchange protein DsbD
MRNILAFAILFLISLTAPAAQAQFSLNNEPKATNALVADVSQVQLGDSFHLALHQVMVEHWHTYWRNPGDAGLPVEFIWRLPEGVTPGEIIWPEPEFLPVGDLIMDYGYEDELVLPMTFTVAEDFAGDVIRIEATAQYLICEEQCIPEEAEVALVIPVGGETRRDPYGAVLIGEALDAVPPLAEGLDVEIASAGNKYQLTVRGGVFSDPDAQWRDLVFMPFRQGLIEHAPEQVLSREAGGASLTLKPFIDEPISAAEPGLLSYEQLGSDGEWARVRVEINALPGAPIATAAIAPPAPPSAPISLASLGVMLGLAFLGGLVLNLMPCVFPVLSIKALSFAQVAHEDPAKVRRHGFFFLAGVISSFVFLAALFVILGKVGLPVGWGFQLQTPIVVAALSLLFFAIGLNLMGMFDVLTSLQGVGSGLADKDGWRGAFFTGVLAVVVAAPCVGPFAAGALGLALTQPPIVLILIAATLGLGLAFPFVLLSLQPGLLRLLPKPGAWMNTFKQVLAFPMFAAALWLLTVLVDQAYDGAFWLGLAMISLVFALWAGKRSARVWRILSAAGLVLMIVSTAWVSRLELREITVREGSGAQTWSRELVSDLRAQGRPIFVDFTATWCMTCQLNKTRVLNTDAVRGAFAENDVAFLIADWTNRDDEITAVLAEYGQAGVPFYLVYPADGGPAEILPTLLSRDIVIEAVEEAAAP